MLGGVRRASADGTYARPTLVWASSDDAQKRRSETSRPARRQTAAVFRGGVAAASPRVTLPQRTTAGPASLPTRPPLRDNPGNTTLGNATQLRYADATKRHSTAL